MKRQFADLLLNWYAAHRRTLPWRGISDPYKIWVSEIILQQTRVAQGFDYYERFIEAFPTVDALALADEDEVMRLWQGLGYYSRARNMHAAARQIVERGSFPETYEEVRKLKGVGDYTAAAICSFAFNQPLAVVDGNVYRVLSRYLGIEEPIDTSHGKKLFAQLAAELLPPNRAADYNQAVMDFGALQCIPSSPDCAHCVLNEDCAAYLQGSVSQLPIKQHRTKVAERFFVYLLVSTPDGIWLRQRGQGDIWQGLYEPPLLEFPHMVTCEEIRKHPFVKRLPPGATWTLRRKDLKHVLTHRIIHAAAYNVAYAVPQQPPQGFLTVRPDDLGKYALPRLVERIFLGNREKGKGNSLGYALIPSPDTSP